MTQEDSIECICISDDEEEKIHEGAVDGSTTPPPVPPTPTTQVEEQKVVDETDDHDNINISEPPNSPEPKRPKVVYEPPPPDSDESIPGDLLFQSVPERLKYLATFWELRREAPYFAARRLRSISLEAVSAMDTIINNKNNGEMVFEIKTGRVVCKYRWEGQSEWVTGTGETKEKAQLAAAKEALCVMMGDLEFHRVSLLSSSLFSEGITSAQLQQELSDDPPEERLKDFLKTKEQGLADFMTKDVHHVRVKVRGNAFDAIYEDEENARNMAAFEAIQYLFGSELEY